MKAAWRGFLDSKMEELRKENPKLKRSQLVQMVSKEVNLNHQQWKTHSENPIVKAKELGVWKGDKKAPKKEED